MPKELKLLRFPKIPPQAFIYLACLVLILANSIWLFPLLSKIKQDIATLQLEIVYRAADETSNFINNHSGELERVSGNIAFLGNRESFLSSLLKDKDIQQVTLIDETGKETLKIHRYRKIYPEELKNRTGEKGIEQVLSTGQNYIGPVFTENLEPMVNMIIPLKVSEEKIIGALETTLSLKSLWTKVGDLKIGNKGLVYIVDTNGMIIVHKDPVVVLSGTYVLDKEIARRLIVDKKTVDGLGSESRYLDINGNEVFGVGVPLTGLGWGVIAEQPFKDAFAAKTQVIILAGVALGISFVLLLSLQIVISRLIRTTSELTQKYRQLEFQKNESDRISKMLVRRDLQLSETREWLEEALRESDKARLELEEAKKGLEIKVQERTKELEELAESLEVRVEERTKELEKSKIALTSILEEVEKERNKTSTIIKNLADGLLVFDSKDRLSLINFQSEIFFQMKTEEVMGKFLPQLAILPIFKPLAELLLKETAGIFRRELQLKENLVLEISTIPLATEKEKLGKLVILHDVTREKEIERLKTEFVSISAHQLRTPLSAIKWSLKMLLDGDVGSLTPEQSDFLKKGYESNERMINLVNDLLNITRIEEGRFIYDLTPQSLEEIIAEIVHGSSAIIKTKKIKLIFNKPKQSLPKVKIDKEKISIAIQNLIDNAIRFNNPGGQVTISIKHDKLNLEVMVKDKGIGIPRDEQKRIFDKFFRANNAIKLETEGSGLGLFICKNIIEAHGGKIWFESKLGQGATFWFSLPIKSQNL